MTHDEAISEVLRSAKTIAVVGLSDKPWRPSYRVSQYMQSEGYRIIPINPRIEKTLGEVSYSRLEDVLEKIDIVNIFRRPGRCSETVKEAIRLDVPNVWMQEGVVDSEAARLGEKAGLFVVMDCCILKYHRHLLK